MNLNKPLILASGSPRRKELLTLAGIPFTVMVSSCEEHTDKTLPQDIVLDLSRQKAEDIAMQMHDPCFILGADTIVACEGQILGKPADADDARRMISLIAGRTHQVYTGVTLLDKSSRSAGVSTAFYEATDVIVSPLDEDEIEAYMQAVDPRTGKPEWKDKAGAYAIQGVFGSRHILALHGDYYNVVGLPVGRVYQALRHFQGNASA